MDKDTEPDFLFILTMAFHSCVLEKMFSPRFEQKDDSSSTCNCRLVSHSTANRRRQLKRSRFAQNDKSQLKPPKKGKKSFEWKVLLSQPLVVVVAAGRFIYSSENVK